MYFCFDSFNQVWENWMGRNELRGSLNLWGGSKRTRDILPLWRGTERTWGAFSLWRESKTTGDVMPIRRGTERSRKCLFLSVRLEKDRIGLGGDCHNLMLQKGSDMFWRWLSYMSVSKRIGQVLVVTVIYVCLKKDRTGLGSDCPIRLSPKGYRTGLGHDYPICLSWKGLDRYQK